MSYIAPLFRGSLCALLIGLFASACTTTTPPTPPEPPKMPTSNIALPGAGAAAFDAKLLAAAQKADGVRELRIYLNADGTPRKASVYHTDASRIPAAVNKLVQEKYPGGTPNYYEYEKYADGTYTHEVDLKTADGAEVEVSAKEDGTLKYVESYMATDAIPEAIKKAVADKLPGGTIAEVEIKEGPGFYEASVKVKADGPGAHYMTFGRDNALIRHTIRYPASIEIPVP